MFNKDVIVTDKVLDLIKKEGFLIKEGVFYLNRKYFYSYLKSLSDDKQNQENIEYIRDTMTTWLLKEEYFLLITKDIIVLDKELLFRDNNKNKISKILYGLYIISKEEIKEKFILVVDDVGNFFEEIFENKKVINPILNILVNYFIEIGLISKTQSCYIHMIKSNTLSFLEKSKHKTEKENDFLEVVFEREEYRKLWINKENLVNDFYKGLGAFKGYLINKIKNEVI